MSWFNTTLEINRVNDLYKYVFWKMWSHKVFIKLQSKLSVEKNTFIGFCFFHVLCWGKGNNVSSFVCNLPLQICVNICSYRFYIPLSNDILKRSHFVQSPETFADKEKHSYIKDGISSQKLILLAQTIDNSCGCSLIQPHITRLQWMGI